jgi:hypothetical protein
MKKKKIKTKTKTICICGNVSNDWGEQKFIKSMYPCCYT